MNKADQIIKDNIPSNSMIQSYKENIRHCMEDMMVEILNDFHSFGQLNLKVVRRLSSTTGLDCEKLCNDNGIIYKV